MLNQPLTQKGTTAMSNSSLPEMLIAFGAPITHRNTISMMWDAATDEQKEGMLNDVKEHLARKGNEMLIAVMDTKAVHAPMGKGMRYYPEVRIIRLQHMFYSTDFQLLSENPKSTAERVAFWKEQGSIFGSQAL